MHSLTIYQDNYNDATVISNYFIDEYMKDANDAQLKVYLYLIRMMSACKATSISDIADKFNHTEKDVLRALKYWEKNKLISLEYNESKQLVGIHLKSIDDKSETLTISQAQVQVVTAKEIVIPPESMNKKGPGSIASTLIPFEKSSYTLDQLREFKDNEETSQLLFVVEQYLGKTLSASEIRAILFISDQLHFSVDLIDYLIQYCVERGKKDFRYIEKVAMNWVEEGITSPKQAAKSNRKYDKIVYTIMSELGKSNTPTACEADYIMRWTKELGFSSDIIFEACKRTVMATEKHRFEYANTILLNWYAKKVSFMSDIQSLDDAYSKNKSTDFQAKALTGNKFNQFKQNNYDFDALEKELLSN